MASDKQTDMTKQPHGPPMTLGNMRDLLHVIGPNRRAQEREQAEAERKVERRCCAGRRHLERPAGQRAGAVVLPDD
jgi:hypothetical protein